MTDDEMAGWQQQLNGHEFEQTLGESEAWCAAVHRITKNRTQLREQRWCFIGSYFSAQCREECLKKLSIDTWEACKVCRKKYINLGWKGNRV